MYWNDESLRFPDGRTVSYAHAGDVNSSDVVVFYHGVFGIGEITRLQSILLEKGVHYIAPTVPGWGKSSLPTSSQTFHECLYHDITAIIQHLYPQTDGLRLYISGGSFGTVAAQMLCGASYEHFPLGRQIKGLLLLGPISPPHIHKNQAKGLSWMNYIAIGPVSRIIPFNLTQRLGASLLFRSKVDTEEHATAFIRDFAFSKLSPSERKAYDSWREGRGVTEEQVVKEIGRNVYLSVKNTWEGFYTTPSVINSDWGGYDPRSVHEERKSPVLIVMNEDDHDHKMMGEWLVKNMKDATGMYVAGGHMASMFFMDEIWAKFFDLLPS